MTLLGKVFTGLILVMSVMFMSFAIVVYATHVNWKTEVSTLQTEVQNGKARIDQVKAELQRSKNALAREQAARRAVLANLRTQRDEKDAELRVKTAENQTLQNERANLSETAQNQSEELKKLHDEILAIRQALNGAIDTREEVFQRLVALTDEKTRLEGTATVLQGRLDDMFTMVTKAKGHLDKLGVRLEDEFSTEAPNRKGFVTKVGNTGGMIEINLGDDDGIREGHELYVYRGATYLGRAVIVRTSADFAVAEIVKDVNRSVLIRKGDRVTTKLG